MAAGLRYLNLPGIVGMRLAALWLALACIVLAPKRAHAEPTEADRATARALALEGHAALTSRDYATAIDRFERADALVHAPTLVVDWARSLQGMGRFVEAHEKYELVLREGVDSSAPKSWARALEDAKRELEELRPRLAWITVTLIEPDNATVRIDGVVVPPAAVGVKRAADPGFPKVRVSADGYEPFEQTLTVGPGEERNVEVSLKKRQDRKLQQAQPDSDAAYRARPGPSVRRITTYALLGVGAAGLVTGGVTGILALHKRSQLADACRHDRCLPSQRSRIHSYHLYGTTSGVTLAVGLASLGGGLALLFTEPKADADKLQSRAGVRPVLSPFFLGAEGSF